MVIPSTWLRSWERDWSTMGQERTGWRPGVTARFAGWDRLYTRRSRTRKRTTGATRRGHHEEHDPRESLFLERVPAGPRDRLQRLLLGEKGRERPAQSDRARRGGGEW